MKSNTADTHDIRGEFEFAFEPDGLRCTMVIPVKESGRVRLSSASKDAPTQNWRGHRHRHVIGAAPRITRVRTLCGQSYESTGIRVLGGVVQQIRY